MTRAFSGIICICLIASCRSLPAPVVVTETAGGEALTMQEVQKTGDRDDVPTGEKAPDVVSTASYSHAGGKIAKVTVTKKRWNPWATPKVYFNCIDCHRQTPQELGLEVEQPKDPWYKWPLMLLAISVIALVFYGASYIRTALRALGWRRR